VSDPLRDGPLASHSFDVAVVGAGVVGCAIARRLARRGAAVALLEAAGDVGSGTSKANTALLHTGYDAKPGTLEARLVARGYELLLEFAREVGVPVAIPGAVMVAWGEDDEAALPQIEEIAQANGYGNTRRLDASELRSSEPELGPGARAGLAIPDEGIVCTFTTTLALASEAVLAGAYLALNARVTDVSVGGEGTVVHTPRGELRTNYVVNAAGLYSDRLNRLFGHSQFTITPRRGELLVFDKLARPLLRHIVLPVPTARTKGVLVAPTVYGNVLVGPTAVDQRDRVSTPVTPDAIEHLRRAAARILPGLTQHDVTATYAGLRAATEHVDYQIEPDESSRYVSVGGIRSTGLTASMAIAEHVASELERIGLTLVPDEDGPRASMPNIGELAPRPYRQPDRIAADPQYGTIVCFCERVTRGEIRDALHSRIPPNDIDGLRRRTRVTMGRCQGFFCGASVARTLESSNIRGRAEASAGLLAG
jgi:glycerol-3-phosphate dehydrogenase